MEVFESIKHSLASELRALDQLIMEELASDEPLVEQIGHHIISSGGKRLRPILCLLSSKMIGLDSQQAIIAATIIEFIHTATLLHDDVIDHATLRRGKTSAHHIWGSEASVLVGDFLYSRAFQLMVRLNQMPIMQLLANTTNTIAEGEVMQLAQARNPSITETQYLSIITAKTATLFSAATQIAPLLLTPHSSQLDAAKAYGHHLGLAFQLIDDALDYHHDNPKTGKTPLKDLQEGKLTLPLIYTLQQASVEERNFLQQNIAKPNDNTLMDIHALVMTKGGVSHTLEAATHQANLAIKALDPLASVYDCQFLYALADFAIKRHY